MKKQEIPFLCALALFLIALACEPASPQIAETENAEVQELTYDSLKAQQYGADDYGMKKYVMAFLKRGPNRDLDSVKAAELQAAHMGNIVRLAEEKKLILAGPFFGDGDLRGIYIFDTPTIAEAKALTESDPAIQAGSLEMELLEWYGSAALMELNTIHETLQKVSIAD